MHLRKVIVAGSLATLVRNLPQPLHHPSVCFCSDTKL